MENLIFSVEAVGAILVECYRGATNGETGGILIGPRNQKRIITDAIPSTSHAERNYSTYYQTAKDVEILNSELRRFQTIGYDFRGYYHKHPSGFFSLSGGDLTSCAEILKSPNYKIGNYLVMCVITAASHQDFPIFSYVVSLRKKGRVMVKKANIRILPKRCIQEYIECFEEERNENNGAGQTYQRIDQQGGSNTVRAQGCQQHHTVIDRGSEGAGEDRTVPEVQESPGQHLEK